MKRESRKRLGRSVKLTRIMFETVSSTTLTLVPSRSSTSSSTSRYESPSYRRRPTAGTKLVSLAIAGRQSACED